MSNERRLKCLELASPSGILTALLAASLLTGCGSLGLGQLMPGGAKPTDLRLKGVVSGEPEDAILTAAGEETKLGCTIPFNVEGETEERVILLVDKFAHWCKALKIFEQIVIDSVPGATGLLKPTAINPEGVGR